MTLDKLAEMVANGFADTNGRIDALDSKLSARIDELDGRLNAKIVNVELRLGRRMDILTKEVLRQGEVMDDLSSTLKSHSRILLDHEGRLEKLES